MVLCSLPAIDHNQMCNSSEGPSLSDMEINTTSDSSAEPVFLSDASKVICHGPGLSKGFLGRKNTFYVDCSKAGECSLTLASNVSREMCVSLRTVQLLLCCRTKPSLCGYAWPHRPLRAGVNHSRGRTSVQDQLCCERKRKIHISSEVGR